MPKQRKAEPQIRLTAADKLANVAALLLVKGMNQTDSIIILTRAGFPPFEIEMLLDASAQVIANANYMARKSKGKKKPKKVADR
jgi:hypothetical protein